MEYSVGYILYGKMKTRTMHSDFYILIAQGGTRGVSHNAAPMVTCSSCRDRDEVKRN